MKSKVYFCKELTAEAVLRMYRQLEITLPGRVAMKVHSGEAGNPNFLRPEFWKAVADFVGGTIVECNTAYEGARNTTARHRALFQAHGWCDVFPVDILDSEGPDMELSIPDGAVIQKNFVGKNMANYDSALILSHFKGHPMGGFGGALKQLAIGFASSYGKEYIHGVGDPAQFWDRKQERFLEAMADAASSVVRYFDGKLAYINVMKNLSVDCDCCGASAKLPCMQDVGILVSLDPVAIDQACVDLVYASDDPGTEALIQRIESRQGIHTLEAAEKLGIGSRDYELIGV